MNACSFIGRVGKDPAKVRYTQGGDAVAGWSIAVDSGYGDKKTTLWIDCSLWGKRSEKVAEFITAGSQIGVTGELGQREHDGKRYLTLRVADVTLIGGKKDGQERKPRASATTGDDFADDEIPGF